MRILICCLHLGLGEDFFFEVRDEGLEGKFENEVGGGVE